MVVYQPQIASWDNQKHLVMYAAVAHTAKASTTPLLGTIRAEAETRVSTSERLVDFSKLTITESHFAGASKEQVAAAVDAVKTGMSEQERVISLVGDFDRLS